MKRRTQIVNVQRKPSSPIYFLTPWNTHTSPELRTLFMYSRNPSSLISLSVNINVMPLPSQPAVRYRNFRSSIRLITLYDLYKPFIDCAVCTLDTDIAKWHNKIKSVCSHFTVCSCIYSAPWCSSVYAHSLHDFFWRNILDIKGILQYLHGQKKNIKMSSEDIMRIDSAGKLHDGLRTAPYPAVNTRCSPELCRRGGARWLSTKTPALLSALRARDVHGIGNPNGNGSSMVISWEWDKNYCK